MTSRQRLQPLAITGYYEYLSQLRHRVNVAPSEEAVSEEAMKQTTSTSPTTAAAAAAAAVIDDENGASGSNSSLTDDLEKQFSNLNGKDVKKWSSADVKKWVEQQCQKFELKKTTSEKFQMNGQALVLLTKHDFLRRSSDGGEILYYALQRLINPDKANTARVNQSLMRNGSSRQNPRIVELDSDTDEHNSTAGSTSSRKPIVEDPDDPPSLRRSTSDTVYDNFHQQQYSHPFVFNNAHIRQPVFTTPAGVPPAYFHQQQQAFPNAFMYAQHHHHHVHPHMSQQQFFHPHSHSYPQFVHQNHPMMSTPGVLIEIIEDEEIVHPPGNGVNPSMNETSANGTSSDAHEQLYLVTINGQRQVMNEDQATQLVAHMHQQQMYQQHQQQQQQFQQAQQHFQQSQQHFQQHQPHFHQQQQPQAHAQQQPQFSHQQQQQQQQQQQPSQDNVYHSS